MTNITKYSVISFSFVLAWLLTIIPLPSFLLGLRPEWITLLLIFWAFRAPEVIGVGIAWCIGLMLDVLNGALLGQYALSMAIVIYLARLFSHRMRVFPLWHQTIIILILVGFGKLSLLMVQWLMGHPPATLWYWSSTITSMLMWPWILRIMRFYGRTTLR